MDIRNLEDIEEIEHLVPESESEGFSFVTRLVEEWLSGENAFDSSGEALLVAQVDDEVVGVCGLNIDPYIDQHMGRVRHLYVSVTHRRGGVGSALVKAIIELAESTFELLRLRTLNPDAAAFYEALGFEWVAGDEYCTHQLHLGSS